MAAFVGVAATGVAIARAERKRRAYTPEQIRERLRERHAQAEAAAVDPPAAVAAVQEGPVRRALSFVRALPSAAARRLRRP
ncbi:hypothetical protein [Nocardiopsis algeriensis]|uniref:hypothetical protein n=1 Tax=Nocardiopsis algeriensis TaxID=1478215 RepID=UPI00160F2E78